ncbi:hypothetical protein HK100_007419 [Physocladia obscura]|uniref:Uncharacterized protein n=1 Tax=Physocladia obscura TaxID=109957 RepID=A0AAD5TFA8_9FUNG|nr:hypothetical protein HK100_007419 [Physocladia obscura]
MNENRLTNIIRRRLGRFGVNRGSEEIEIAPTRVPLLDNKLQQLNLDNYTLRTMMKLANVNEFLSDSDSDSCGFAFEHTSEYVSEYASDLESESVDEFIQACSDQSEYPALEPNNNLDEAPFPGPELYVIGNDRYQYEKYEPKSDWVGDRVSTPPPDFAEHQTADTEYTKHQQQQQKQNKFSVWLTGASIGCYYLLHAIPFLRFVVIRLQRKAGRSNALLMTSIFSALVGFYIALNRKEAELAFKRACPTKETVAVYNAIAASIVFTHVAPRLFMMLHFICNHVPLVGSVLVFLVMVVVIVGLFFAMLAAVSAYSVDVTVTLHGALKGWLGYRKVDGSNEKRLPVKNRNVMDLPPSYVGF